LSQNRHFFAQSFLSKLFLKSKHRSQVCFLIRIPIFW
jgi:hypothetical protein